jgi:hypothetical protein
MVSSCVLNDDAFPDALPGVGIFMCRRATLAEIPKRIPGKPGLFNVGFSDPHHGVV